MMDCTFDFIVTLYIRTRELTYIQHFSYFKQIIIIYNVINTSRHEVIQLYTQIGK